MNAADHHVYIVAADPLARGGLVALLETASGWTITAQTDPATAARDLASQLTGSPHPTLDLLLWDGGWNPSEHLITLVTIAEERPDLPILALLDDPHHAPALRRAGVNGLLLRTTETHVLLAAMHATAAGLLVIDPAFPAAGRFPPSLADAAGDVPDLAQEHVPEPLTPRELDVLKLVAEGLPNKTIARKLTISEHTVKFHMNSILGKLNAQSRTEAVITAGRAGIIQV